MATTAAAPVAAESCLQPGSEVTIINQTNVRNTVNPLLAIDTTGYWRTDLVFDLLVDVDPNTAEIVPELARSWDISDDNLTYTFHLQEGVIFHDGAPVTAADVEFTIESILAPGFLGQWRPRLANIVGADAFTDGSADSVAGVEVHDDYTISITLAKPDASFMAISVREVLKVLPKHLLEGEGPIGADHPFSLHPIGSGPYEFVQWTEEKTTFKAFDGYWQPNRGCIETVHHGGIQDVNTMLVAMETEQAHAMDRTPPGDIDRMVALPHIDVATYDKAQLDGLVFNVESHEALANPDVRRAIAMAIDKESFVTNFLGQYATVRNSFLISNSWAFDASVEMPPYDPDGAAALLAQAGYPGGEGIELTFFYNDGNSNREGLAIYAQAELAKLGIDVTIETAKWPQFIEAVRNGEFNVAVMSLHSGFPDPAIIGQTYGTGEPENHMNYSNSAVDEALTAALLTTDVEERKAHYSIIQQNLAADTPFVPVFSPPGTVLYNSDLLTDVFPSNNRMYWDVREWKVNE
ncbi:MAG: ABC transporter substrate-binding protein [bacterium]|nr:ABC transporter substrate-binding protein [bacterium]